MEVLKLEFTGESPLLMHSDRGANPLDPMTKAHKELTSKRKKTDEDYDAIAKSEWYLGFYFDKKIGPYIPAAMIRASISAGGRVNKLGMAIKRGTLILQDQIPLKYNGPKDQESMWNLENEFRDIRSVVVSTNRVMRCRPIFREWSLKVEVLYDPAAIDREQLITAAKLAGSLSGLGDYRPSTGGSFGRFTVKVL